MLLDAAPKGVQWLFSNRIAAFLSAVSYNFYIWHSTVLLKLKAWRIPYYPDAPEGAAAWPQSAGGEPWHFAWQVKYTVLFWAFALLLAAFFTYLIEKPTAKQLLRKKKITRTKKQTATAYFTHSAVCLPILSGLRKTIPFCRLLSGRKRGRRLLLQYR